MGRWSNKLASRSENLKYLQTGQRYFFVQPVKDSAVKRGKIQPRGNFKIEIISEYLRFSICDLKFYSEGGCDGN